MNTEPRRRYTREFKAQAVEIVGLGRPVPEVAEELGIGCGILYRWVSTGSQLGSAGVRAVGEEAGADELRVLRRENVNLKLENDILKKAAVIPGTSPHGIRAK